MALALRHRPEVFDLTLDSQGWCLVEDLIRAFTAQGTFIDRELLELVVLENDKQRFSFSVDGCFIRANQGHSIPVDLGYEAIEPPLLLYHGTAKRFLKAIRQEGLRKRNRHHVHLSKDKETAVQVGMRHGKPVVLTIKAKVMATAGIRFFRSANGVWLTDKVAPSFIEFPDIH